MKNIKNQKKKLKIKIKDWPIFHLTISIPASRSKADQRQSGWGNMPFTPASAGRRETRFGKVEIKDCIRAPPKQRRYWKIHPWHSSDFPRAKPEEVRTFTHHQSFHREWISKSFPVEREGLTVLKSTLPCWWQENDPCFTGTINFVWQPCS